MIVDMYFIHLYYRLFNHVPYTHLSRDGIIEQIEELCHCKVELKAYTTILHIDDEKYKTWLTLLIGSEHIIG